MNHETNVGDCGGTQTASKQVWQISGPSLQVKSLVNHVKRLLEVVLDEGGGYKIPVSRLGTLFMKCKCLWPAP